MKPSQKISFLKKAYQYTPNLWTASVDGFLKMKLSRRPSIKIDIMTSFEGKNFEVIQVLLLSISESHPEDQVVFWLLVDDASDDQISSLSSYCEKLGNVTFNLIRISDNHIFSALKSLGGKPDSARFFWLAAHQYLPRELNRIIYLDAADILVTDDLAPMLHHPFLGKYLVACREHPNRPPLLFGPARNSRKMNASGKFLDYAAHGLINTGVILINLEKLRKDDVTLSQYLEVAEWASQTKHLKFGDQGLFSLTHGSNYLQAHNRYNYRFYDEPRANTMSRPAVIHYCGQVLKPANWKFTKETEEMVTQHLIDSGNEWLYLDKRRRIGLAHLPYLRKWWAVCERTPAYAQLAPIATNRLEKALTKVGLNCG